MITRNCSARDFSRAITRMPSDVSCATIPVLANALTRAAAPILANHARSEGAAEGPRVASRYDSRNDKVLNRLRLCRRRALVPIRQLLHAAREVELQACDRNRLVVLKVGAAFDRLHQGLGESAILPLGLLL